jgi:UDP-N-acetylmuramoylalanine--D-glutamate ligase
LTNYWNLKDPAVYRPTGFADLAGKRVGIFGFGVEGRAANERLLGIASSVVLVDDAPDRGPHVLKSNEGGLEALATCDVVLKSPGIPRRRADILNLEEQGVTVTSALNVWLHETDLSRVVAVTGTKGKSTTTSLISFFFTCLGERSLALGNLGQPPYDPTIDTTRGWLVLEVSSFQCVDIDVAPATVVVTSLGADHLDWHGSLEQYHDDKLSLTRAAGDHRTFVPHTSLFHELAEGNKIGGAIRFVDADASGLAEALGLLGHHNDANVGLALDVVSSLANMTVDELRAQVRAKAPDFKPLPGRLTLVVEEHIASAPLRFVDDGLATSTLATIAALDFFANDSVALLVGGQDRGVDYGDLVATLHHRHEPTCVIAMGEAGERIAGELRGSDDVVDLFVVSSMFDAIYKARSYLASGGVVLLSPAAPSFDSYRNWKERSEDFARSIIATRP